MMERMWLSVSEVLNVHTEMMEAHGGKLEIRDMAALETALLRPQVGNYERVTAAGAALFESMVTLRPFARGNKPTAFAVMDVFLRVNGWRLTCKPNEVLGVMLDPSEVDWRVVEDWLLENGREG